MARKASESDLGPSHLGNFPQAFSHLALINAVMHVIHAETGVPHKFGAGATAPQP